MTQSEIFDLLKFASSIYPAQRMDESEMTRVSNIWHSMLEPYSSEKVMEAFKYAMMENTRYIPSLPEILKAIDEVAMIPKPKSPEQEFRDTHCGKDPEEWERDEAWRNSEEGKKKIAWYYEQFDKLFGVKFSA